jgi:hypothetical protein
VQIRALTEGKSLLKEVEEVCSECLPLYRSAADHEVDCNPLIPTAADEAIIRGVRKAATG